MSDIQQKRDQLLQRMQQLESVAVAFSGGVDSAVVAKAAHLALRDRAVAVTAVSPSLASGELELAQRVASAIGIRHETVETNELGNAAYVANGPDRCFHCKDELYSLVGADLTRLHVEVIANGANLDDLGDHRPGMRAAADHQVVSPLADCQFTKADVRELARHWNLEVADKPATPCLSSRIAYGESVTPERLNMIDRAEQWLRDHGFGDVRVRYHGGDLARLEVDVAAHNKLIVEPHRTELVDAFRGLGFRFITLDLEGRRSGSLNTLVPVESIERPGG